MMKSLAIALGLAVAVPATTTVPAFAHDAKTTYRAAAPSRTLRQASKDTRHAADWRRRGAHLPATARGPVVSNWQRHGLRRPPSGHRWVKVDNDYILFATATGIIASIVAASR